MIIEINRSTIEGIKEGFISYGFANSPLTDKQIVRLLSEGFNQSDIYNIGGIVNSGAFNNADDAAQFYLNKQTKGA